MFSQRVVRSNDGHRPRTMTGETPETEVDEVSYLDLVTDGRFLLTILVTFTGGLAISGVPVALPAIAETLQVSDGRIGLVQTVFALPIIVMIPLVGVLADTYGRRPIVLWSLALFGLSGVATLMVSSFEVLLALRVLQGIAFVGTLPLSTTIVGDLYTGPTGASAQGIRASVGGVAGIVAPAIAGVLAGLAWNYPFGLFAFAFPVLLLVYLYFPEPLSDGAIKDDTPVMSALSGYWTAFREEANDFTFLLLAVGGFIDLFVRQALLVFVPLYAVRIVGASVFEIGLVISAYGVIRAISSPFAGEFVSTLGRKRTLALAIGFMGLGLGALPLVSGVVLVGVLVVVFGAGEAVFIPSLNDSMAAFASEDRRAGIIGSIQSIKNIGRAVAPAFFGVVLAVGGFPVLFLTAGVIAGLYASVVLTYFDSDTI